MSVTTKRPAARLAKPVGRYWRGKAPKGVKDHSDESGSEVSAIDEEEERDFENDRVPIVGDVEGNNISPQTKSKSAPAISKSISIALKDVDISKEGKVIVAGLEESGKTLVEKSLYNEDDDGEDDSQLALETSEESSEYESESDDQQEEIAQHTFRPVFVPKRARTTVLDLNKEAADSEEALKKMEQEIEEKRKQSHDMVAESIRRELAEKEKEEEEPDVDDLDGLDPYAEFEAWRLRELARIKRDKEEQLRRDEEKEEIERRRALPEEQRLKEDIEHAKKTREEKPKGKQKFLQKYWHKGAFHQDIEIIKKRDYTEATESTVDVTLLPKVMQVRDFGKRSRTKYTHLLDQDTSIQSGGFGSPSSMIDKSKADSGEPGGGCFICGGPHLKKDCPQTVPGPIVLSTDRSKTVRRELSRDIQDRDWSYRDRDERRSSSYSKNSSRYLEEERRYSGYKNAGRDRFDDERRRREQQDVQLDYGRRSRSPQRSSNLVGSSSRKDRRHSRDKSRVSDERHEKRMRAH